uniref:Cytochrome c6 n=1 Tax=Riquetophycus sp. TaxID=1897556 RepID=A0A1C9C895_9FLOR|nr:cytochrome c553 [Riquetophycus sp.]
MRHILAFLIVLNIILITENNNFALANLEEGEQIFTANCAACHSGGNNAIMPEKTLKSDVLAENNMNSIEAITNQVRNGKNAMPPFGGRLSDEDIENVAKYVLNQSEQGW